MIAIIYSCKIKSIKFLYFNVQHQNSTTGYLSEEKNPTSEKVANISDVTLDAGKHFEDATDAAINENVSSGPSTEETTGFDAFLTSTAILQPTTDGVVTTEKSSKY